MVSFFVLIGIILLIGALFFRVMLTFLVPLFFAAVLVVIFRPVYRWMAERFPGRKRLAAGLTTGVVLLVVLVPAGLVFSFAAIEASSLLTQFDVATIKSKTEKLRIRVGLDMPLAGQVRRIEGTLNRLYDEHERFGSAADGAAPPASRADRRLGELAAQVQQLAQDLQTVEQPLPAVDLEPLQKSIGRLRETTPGTLDYEATLQVAMRQFREMKLTLWGGPYRAWMVDLANPSDEDVLRWSSRAFSEARTWLLSVGGATTAFAAKLLLGSVIMVVAVYFFLVDGPDMTQAIMRLSPLDDRYEEELLDEFDRISRAVVMATLLSAVVQGVLAGFGYWLVGLDAVFLLMLLTMVMALVPFLGAASVWGTATFWLYFYEERTWPAIFLLVYGTAIVSMADNVIKPWVLHGSSKLHPLLALLSVLGGIQALGPVGILVGPMVVAFLQTLLNILHRELLAFDRSAAPRLPSADAVAAVDSAGVEGRAEPSGDAAGGEDGP
jgi:predicted PurR-regulated permease PerM